MLNHMTNWFWLHRLLQPVLPRRYFEIKEGSRTFEATYGLANSLNFSKTLKEVIDKFERQILKISNV